MRKPLFAFAVPLGFLCVAAVTAQNPPSQNPPSHNPPASHPPPARSPPSQKPTPQDVPPQDRTPRSGSTNQRDQTDPTGEPGAAPNVPPPFDTLDHSSTGYLTRADAARDRWLGGHFQQCDADRDGRLTRAEYDHCTRAPQR